MVDRAEARVVVVVIDVDQHLDVAQRRKGVAIEVAAVEEDHRAAREVLGGGGAEAIEAEEPVLVWQRKLVGSDQDHRVLAARPQHARHRDQRPERVAVGVLVGDHDEALAVADVGDHVLACTHGQADVGHAPPPRSSPSTRRARSVVAS